MKQRNIAIAVALAVTFTAPAVNAYESRDMRSIAKISRLKTCKSLGWETILMASACKEYPGFKTPAFCDENSPRERAIAKRSRQLNCGFY